MRLYGALDLAFAALYVLLGVAVVPSRSTVWNLCLFGTTALLAAAGVGLLARARWGRALALVASGVLLAVALFVVVALIASSAYLAGVYGALGRGFAAIALGLAALAVEVFALLPIFQLRFLLASPTERGERERG